MLAARRLVTGASRAVPRRWLGSHHETEAKLFADSQWEGWEPVVYTTYIASAVVLVVGLSYKPQTSILQWAREEAAARLKIEEEGGALEYGTHYAKDAQITFSKDGIGEVPTAEDE